MTTENTYSTILGGNNILDASIAYTKMLMICREGLVMDIIVSNDDLVITNRQALFQPAFGIIQFNTTFNQNETINIVYETNP